MRVNIQLGKPGIVEESKNKAAEFEHWACDFQLCTCSVGGGGSSEHIVFAPHDLHKCMLAKQLSGAHINQYLCKQEIQIRCK